MIDTVSTLTAQNASARQTSRSAVLSAAYVPAEALPVAEASSVSSHIRVDNLQNVAILEYRNNDGDVVRQYPTESQIEAFRRAQEIHEHTREKAAPAPSTEGSSAPVQQQAAAPALAPAVSIAPAAPAPAPVTTSTGGGEGGSTSVVV